MSGGSCPEDMGFPGKASQEGSIHSLDKVYNFDALLGLDSDSENSSNGCMIKESDEEDGEAPSTEENDNVDGAEAKEMSSSHEKSAEHSKSTQGEQQTDEGYFSKWELKPLKFGGLPKESACLYKSRYNMSRFFEKPFMTLDSFFLENEEVQEIWAVYKEHFITALENESSATTKTIQARDQDIELYVSLLQSPSARQYLLYSNPSKSQLQDYEHQNWYARILYRYAIALDREDIITTRKKVSPENRWRWAYLLLKYKEIFESDPENVIETREYLRDMRLNLETSRFKQEEEERRQREERIRERAYLWISRKRKVDEEERVGPAKKAKGVNDETEEADETVDE